MIPNGKHFTSMPQCVTHIKLCTFVYGENIYIAKSIFAHLRGLTNYSFLFCGLCVLKFFYKDIQ